MNLDDFVRGLREFGLTLKKRTATGASNAVTINAYCGTVTTESLSTAAAAEETYTITNNKIKSDSVVLVSVANGTNTTVAPNVSSVTPANGSAVVVLSNMHASSALNGTLKLNFVVH